MKPTDLIVQRVNFFENLWDDEFVEGFLAIAQWARDQVPFPGGVFRQTVDVLEAGLVTDVRAVALSATCGAEPTSQLPDDRGVARGR